MKTFVFFNSEIAKVFLCIIGLTKYLNTLISSNTSMDVGNFSDVKKVGITTLVVHRTIIQVQSWHVMGMSYSFNVMGMHIHSKCLSRIPEVQPQNSHIKHIHGNNQRGFVLFKGWAF